MVYNGNPIKIDDLGVPLFLETPICVKCIAYQKITGLPFLPPVYWRVSFPNAIKITSTINAHLFMGTHCLQGFPAKNLLVTWEAISQTALVVSQPLDEGQETNS